MSDYQELARFLKLRSPGIPIYWETVERYATEKDVSFSKICYRSDDGDTIPAYFWMPAGEGPMPAILVHHQHNGERHLGKSEVAGLIGDPLQAFGPALAARGFVVLAPDSICFEERRRNKRGIESDTEANDGLQHYNEMSYRLVKGDTLMRKVLDDASVAIDFLSALPQVHNNRIGCLGHSYGGNTVMFQAATDQRIGFACASGAVGSYAEKMRRGIGFELSLSVPNIFPEWEIDRVASLICPRPFLVLAGTDDRYAADAAAVCAAAKLRNGSDNPSNLEAAVYDGGHELTQERFDKILAWLTDQAGL